MKNNVVNVCLAWHNLNSNNFGVSALAVSQVALLKKAAKEVDIEVNITTLGTPDIKALSIKKSIEDQYNLKINHVNFSVKKLLKSALSLDFSSIKIFQNYDVVMDIGEGDSFTDIYGLKRLISLSVTKLITILLGKKLVLSPQTIGPFQNNIAKFFAKWMIKKSESVFSRDHKSTKFIMDLGLKCIEVSDVAFTLPYEPKTKLENTVGLNISGLLWNGGYSGNNQFGLTVDYKIFVVDVISEFRKRNKEVHLIGHVIADDIPVEDDYRVCMEIKSLFQDDDKVIIAPKFNSPIEAKSYISQLEFFSGSRMHATIAALSSGVVTVPIAYSRKFSGVFGTLGYSYTLDAYAMETKQMVNKLFEFYDECFVEMTESMQRARKMSIERNELYIDHLKELLINAKS